MSYGMNFIFKNNVHYTLSDCSYEVDIVEHPCKIYFILFIYLDIIN